MKHGKTFRATLLGLLIFSVLGLSMLTSTPPTGAQIGVLPSGTAAVRWQDKVDARVFNALSAGQAEFFIYMKQQADLSGAGALPTKEEKGRHVYERLTATARATQPKVRRTLEQLGAQYQAFWVSNTISAKGDLNVLQAVASLPEVAAVYPNGKGALKLPPAARAASSTSSTGAASAATAGSTSNDSSVEPGLVRVNADDAWSLGVEGQGVVVGGADTGVRWTHRALKNQYRGWDGSAASHDYNWKDGVHTTTWPPDAANPCNPGGPTGVGQPSPAPCDDDELLGGGHGSHTVGSMVGDDGGENRIGMAPRAEWIACRNMSRGVGAMTTYLQCMEWFIAPTRVDGTSPDPAKAPHVVNNSWGCVEGCPPEPNPLRDTLKASRAAGIVYVASAGNDGGNPTGLPPDIVLCNTIYHPLARYPEAFTVGSTTHNTDTISDFSSRGPSAADPENPGSPLYIKPNVSAPGSDIRSALQASDTEYGSLSGTSMAGPHVAGLVALVISANPRLAGRVGRIEEIIEQTAVRKTTTEACGLDTSTQVPNNTYGWGRIDALAAVLDALPPDAVDDSASTTQNAPVVVSVLSNDTDPDGDSLTVGAIGAAGHGTVTSGDDGRLTYTPAGGFSGTDSFTYTVCAPEGCDVASDTATVVVQVASNVVPGNHAAAGNGATATASSVYPNGNYSAASAIDSDRTGLLWGAGGGWSDATRGLFPDWLEVAFNGAKRINEIRVYTLQDGFYAGQEPTAAAGATTDGLIDFDVQYWDGSQWVTAPGGAVRGNALALRAVGFPEVTTTKIRVLTHNARVHYSRVVEVEAYGPPSP